MSWLEYPVPRPSVLGSTRPCQSSPSLTRFPGTIAGCYQDTSAAWHCFLRGKEGGYTTFDSPAAGFIFSATLNPGARLRELTLTQTSCFMASCAPPTAPSQRLMLRAQGQAFSKARPLTASTRRGRSREPTLTGTTWLTALCGASKALAEHAVGPRNRVFPTGWEREPVGQDSSASGFLSTRSHRTIRKPYKRDRPQNPAAGVNE